MPCPGWNVDDVLDAVAARLGGGFGAIEKTGAFHQLQRVVHESGLSIHFGVKRKDQPIVVNATGETCEVLGGDIVRLALDLGVGPSRLDVAMDIPPADEARRKLLQTHRSWQRGQVRTTMAAGSHKLYSNYAPVGGGMTALFGGEGSAVLLRVYDKRGPLRMEFQYRPHPQIREDLPVLIEQKGPAGLWRKLGRNVDFPLTWYRQLLVGDDIDLAPIVEDATTLANAIAAIKRQDGVTLWALLTAGMTLADLAVDPGPLMRGEVARKLKGWVGDLTDLGYDGAKLEAEVRCRLKHRRVIV